MTKPGLGQVFVRAKISAVGSVGCARDFSPGASNWDFGGDVFGFGRDGSKLPVSAAGFALR